MGLTPRSHPPASASLSTPAEGRPVSDRPGGVAAPAARGWHPATLIVVVSGWVAVAGNLPLWRGLNAVDALNGRTGVLLATCLAIAIAALLSALLAPLAWRRTLKPALVAILVVQALSAHYMLTYNIVIDSTMMENVLQTDTREVVELIGLPLLRNLAWLLLPPLLLVWLVPVRRRPWPRALRQNAGMTVGMLALTVLALLAGFQPLSSTVRNHKAVRYLINPHAGLYAVGHTLAAPLRRPPGPLRTVGVDAKLPAAADGRPPMLVLVLGETGRVDHFGLNGYARDTTPGLSKENVASFLDVQSCGTATAASVPCMFSPLGRVAFGSRDADYENVLDVLQHAGLAVFWLDNQGGGCKGVCARVPNQSTVGSKDPTWCKDEDCLDEVLLEGLDERIAALPAERRAKGIVVVLHTMGSHGPAYFKRSPAAQKRFLPECARDDLQNCPHEELINAYDNSIAYVDHVLVRTIRWLQGHQATHDTAMLYIADHGESLGEHNLYLHGIPWAIAPAEQKQVPWITWLSPAFSARNGIDLNCLKGQAATPLTHDNLFHSVLGLLEVQTQAYHSQLDAYAACSSNGSPDRQAAGRTRTQAQSVPAPEGEKSGASAPVGGGGNRRGVGAASRPDVDG